MQGSYNYVQAVALLLLLLLLVLPSSAWSTSSPL
jgi:hypothetical protein